LLDVLPRSTAKIARHRELQGASRNGELQRLGGCLAAQQRSNQPRGAAVASSDAIHHLHDVPPAARARPGRGIVECGAPGAMARDSAAAGPSPSAGVIPVAWNQVASAKTRAQSISPGVIWANAEPARSYTTRIARKSAPGSTK